MQNNPELQNGLLNNSKFISLTKHFEKHNFTLYAVGGCIRDALLKKDIKEIDLTTNAQPEDIGRICKKTILTQKKYGTTTVIWQRESFEITPHRTESNYSDTRHPDKVQFGASLKEDLKRRDFTINAIALDSSGKLYDFFGGKDDIKAKLIRCVGNATERFEEDALRMLRAIRFCAKLNLHMEKDTWKSLQENAKNIVHISPERIHKELKLMFLSEGPDRALELLFTSGMYKYIFKNHSISTADITSHIKNNYKNIEELFQKLKNITKQTNFPSCFLNYTEEDVKEILFFTGLYLPLFELTTKKCYILSCEAESYFTQLRLRRKIIKAITTLLRYQYISLGSKKRRLRQLSILKVLLGRDLSIIHILLSNIVLDITYKEVYTIFKSSVEDIKKLPINNTKDLKVDGKTLLNLKNRPAGKWLGNLQKSLLRFVLVYPNKNNKEDLKLYAQRLKIID